MKVRLFIHSYIH